MRDSVNVGDASDNVTIRFKTDNPGPWMLHWYVFRYASSSSLAHHLLVTLTGT